MRKGKFQCQHCSKCFTTNYSLEVHLRIHTGEKPFPCERCEKSFRLKQHLKIHLRIHTGEKPYACEYCLKTFSQHSTLRRHLRMHTDFKPHECKVCDYASEYKHVLLAHEMTHTDLRPFKCKLCSYRTTSNNNLKSHKIRLHRKKANQNGLLPKLLKPPGSKKTTSINNGEHNKKPSNGRNRCKLLRSKSGSGSLPKSHSESTLCNCKGCQKMVPSLQRLLAHDLFSPEQRQKNNMSRNLFANQGNKPPTSSQNKYDEEGKDNTWHGFELRCKDSKKLTKNPITLAIRPSSKLPSYSICPKCKLVTLTQAEIVSHMNSKHKLPVVVLSRLKIVY